MTAQTQLRLGLYSEQQRPFGISNICYYGGDDYGDGNDDDWLRRCDSYDVVVMTVVMAMMAVMTTVMAMI